METVQEIKRRRREKVMYVNGVWKDIVRENTLAGNLVKDEKMRLMK